MINRDYHSNYDEGSGYGEGGGEGFGFGFGLSGDGSGFGAGFGEGESEGEGSGYGFGFGFGEGEGEGEKIGVVGAFNVRLISPWSLVSVGCCVGSISWWRTHWRDEADKHDVTVSEAEVASLENMAMAERRIDRECGLLKEAGA